MGKIFKCSEFDPEHSDCLFEASGDDEQVLEEAKTHIMEAHGFEEEDMTPEVEDKIVSAIKEDETDYFGDEEGV